MITSRPIAAVAFALSTLSIMHGCGAPTKTPEQVRHIFQESDSLDANLTEVCAQLSERQAEPTIRGKFLSTNECVGAGSIAQNFKSMKAFFFAGLDDKNLKKNDSEIVHITSRSQVWLNSSIVNMVSKLSGLLGEKDGSTPGAVKLPGKETTAGDGLGGLADVDVSFLSPFKFNKETFDFSAVLQFKLTGLIDAEHEIAIDGTLIDNKIAVTIRTTKDKAFEESLLKNFNVVILVIPYAQDIYVDFFIDMNIHSIGFDDAIKSEVNKFLGSGLKSLIDSLVNLSNG